MNLSVVIPNFNQAETLMEAIDSALNQTVPCQIIYVDDGSTDDSLVLAKTYPEITVISQVNKGLASARNTGIMWAHGDYVLPLDADDILEPTCVKRILEVAEKTNADIIAPSFKAFGVSNGEVILVKNPSLEDFKHSNQIGYCSAIKLSALLGIGGYNPKMIYGWEDYDLWVDLLKRGCIIETIPEILWNYRTKEKSMYRDSLAHSDFLKNQMQLNHPGVYAKYFY